MLWLHRRFDLSIAVSGVVFFWAGLLSAFSALLAVRIARRIGLVRTMVFTHLPANVFLILAAFMPNAPLAIAALLVRSALSQMDVPARTSYVMAVVSPAERPAAASVTNVPRSLAAVAPPDPRRLAAEPLDVRLAAGDRRRAQDRLRPAVAAPIPRSSSTRGAARNLRVTLA